MKSSSKIDLNQKPSGSSLLNESYNLLSLAKYCEEKNEPHEALSIYQKMTKIYAYSWIVKSAQDEIERLEKKHKIQTNPLEIALETELLTKNNHHKEKLLSRGLFNSNPLGLNPDDFEIKMRLRR